MFRLELLYFLVIRPGYWSFIAGGGGRKLSKNSPFFILFALKIANVSNMNKMCKSDKILSKCIELTYCSGIQGQKLHKKR